MSIRIIPKRNWLTLRRLKAGETAGGIVLPGEKGYRYVVEAVSEDVEMSIEPGMEVLAPGQAVHCESVDPELKDLFLIRESDIVGLVVRDAS